MMPDTVRCPCCNGLGQYTLGSGHSDPPEELEPTGGGYEGIVSGYRWCATCGVYVRQDVVQVGDHGWDLNPLFLNHDVKSRESAIEHHALDEKKWSARFEKLERSPPVQSIAEE